MDTTVYDSGVTDAHVYCHSRRDGKEGCVYLAINNSLTETLTLELPAAAQRYTLDGDGDIRSSVMYLNGRPLTAGPKGELPELAGETVPTGTITLAPGSCTFLVL